LQADKLRLEAQQQRRLIRRIDCGRLDALINLLYNSNEANQPKDANADRNSLRTNYQESPSKLEIKSCLLESDETARKSSCLGPSSLNANQPWFEPDTSRSCEESKQLQGPAIEDPEK